MVRGFIANTLKLLYLVPGTRRMIRWSVSHTVYPKTITPRLALCFILDRLHTRGHKLSTRQIALASIHRNLESGWRGYTNTRCEYVVLVRTRTYLYKYEYILVHFFSTQIYDSWISQYCSVPGTWYICYFGDLDRPLEYVGKPRPTLSVRLRRVRICLNIRHSVTR